MAGGSGQSKKKTIDNVGAQPDGTKDLTGAL